MNKKLTYRCIHSIAIAEYIHSIAISTLRVGDDNVENLKLQGFEDIGEDESKIKYLANRLGN